MVPRKAYSFVCFTNIDEASSAYHQLNGHVLRGGRDPSNTVILYLFFVERAPSTVMPSQEKPPGLIVIEDFIAGDEESALIQFMEEKFDHTDSGIMKHRQVKHFGFEFKYSINDVDINDPLSDGIPKICHQFLQRAQDQGLVKHFPDQLTVNQYKMGQGIPPHVDTPHAFEDGIMSLSLGSQAVMDFKHPAGHHLSVLIPQRSILVMTGESRYIWSHGITPRKSDIISAPDGSGLTLAHRGTRTSLTFRKVVRERSDQKNSVEGILLPDNDADASALEKEHVQKVYDDIAAHFSGTRYKPWPRVVDFLMEQPEFSLLADVGCGNGKCLGVNNTLYEIGCDFSKKLASICHSRGFETCVGDVTCLPLHTGSVDVVLCIAVIHHLSTKERRLRAVSEVVRVLRPNGNALIYVWALEQDLNQKPSKYINVNRQRNLTCGMDAACDGNVTGLDSPDDMESSIPESNDDDVARYCDCMHSERELRSVGQERRPILSRHCEHRTSSNIELDKSEKEGPNVPSMFCDNSKDPHRELATAVKLEENVTLDDDPATGCVDNILNPGQRKHNTSGKQNDQASKDKRDIKEMLFKSSSHDIEISKTKAMTQINIRHKEKCDIDSLNDKVDNYSADDTNYKQCDGKENTSASTSKRTLHVHVNRTQFKDQDMLVPWKLSAKHTEKEDNSAQTLHRFYHMFRQGELEAVCKRVPLCTVVTSYYDQGNWCAVLQKL